MMKKILAILVIALFLGGITAPAFASHNSSLFTISTVDKDPKKTKETEKKSSESTTEKKSSDCATEKKSSDCNTEAKKDCEKTCGGSSK